MKYKQLTVMGLIAIASLTAFPGAANSGVFGEVALSLGGTYPQTTFTRYADAGLLINGRATIHIPNAEMLAGWFDLSYVSFRRDEHETEFTFAGQVPATVTQTTSESLFSSHIGLQLASMTKRAFFRPRAALGIGIYGFRNDTKWEWDLPDTTLKLAEETLDSQTKFGWRFTIGADLFLSTEWGLTADFVYDHVLGLKQRDGDKEAELTTRFHGFTVGAVYMFSE